METQVLQGRPGLRAVTELRAGQAGLETPEAQVAPDLVAAEVGLVDLQTLQGTRPPPLAAEETGFPGRRQAVPAVDRAHPATPTRELLGFFSRAEGLAEAGVPGAVAEAGVPVGRDLLVLPAPRAALAGREGLAVPLGQEGLAAVPYLFTQKRFPTSAASLSARQARTIRLALRAGLAWQR
jgi:hypothetical protein